MNVKLLLGPLAILGLAAGPAGADYLMIRINIDRVALPDPAKLQAALGAQGAQLMQQPGLGQQIPGQPNPNMMPPGGQQFGNLQNRQQARAMQQAQLQQQRLQAQNQVPNPTPGANPMAEDEFDPSSDWIGAFIEYKAVPGRHVPGVLAEVDTRFGKAVLPIHSALKGSIYFAQVQKEPFPDVVNRKLKKIPRDKSKIEDLLALADWAMTHGLTKKETVKGPDGSPKEAKPSLDRIMEEIAKIDPKHPVVRNFERVRQQLSKSLPDTDPDYKLLLEEMQKEGYRSTTSGPGHYVILSNLPQAPQTNEIVRRRLAQLEEALENFYLWFALQRDLPQPEFPRGRLVAILATTPQEFHARHLAWGAPSMAADGFTPRRDNVMILSGRRLDESYNAFAKAMDNVLQGLNVSREEMLKGSIWTSKDAKFLMFNPQKAAGLIYAQPLTLLLRALEDESENATATHEATRQLLVASGLFPRSVQVPEWVLAGLASYFETPVGAVYGGVGLPSATNLIGLKYHRNAKTLGKPNEILYNVLTDRYFHAAQQSMAEWQQNQDSHQLSRKAHEDSEIARSTAWAFIYYLAQNRKLMHLIKYGQELNRLPRDLDLDEKALQGCFAKAFEELADPKDARRLEPARLQQLADEWLGFMQGINLEEDVVEREYLDLRDQKAKTAVGGS